MQIFFCCSVLLQNFALFCHNLINYLRGNIFFSTFAVTQHLSISTANTETLKLTYYGSYSCGFRWHQNRVCYL